MLACAAAACTSGVRVAASASRRGGGVEVSGACGGGCHNEYLGCIDVC
ncbi:hypothetical protein HU200_064711 [Digitaria exilis]|uniref:Uncharacterized protein n=1 Tax=Digitaria exilis TaxID=1010633 RepID=A0A835A983_9POAL|nr:hypothetical protein HU200_064711 [Digitaria exilis]